MVPRWLTNQDLTRNFLKIQVPMIKRWLTPQNDRPGSHLEFFLKIQHVYGQRMIDPLVWQSRISPGIFLKSQHAHGQKMIHALR